MNNETLKRDLCARIPNNPLMQWTREEDKEVIQQELNLSDAKFLINKRAKLILHPISALTKPIQMANYNNGEPFVPLKELYRLNELNEFSKNKEMLRRIFVDNVISCDFIENDGSMFSSDYAQLKYTVDTNMGTLIYSFGYNATMRRFDARDETHKRPLGVAYQLDMFDLLNKWHINYRLSPEQFIEVTDEFNPYK